MKKYIKNRYFTIFIFFFYASSCASASHISCSFDYLFPMTWYQKGLESSLSVWHTLSELFEKNETVEMPYDLLLGKLTFAQFCVARMVQEQVRCIPEDSAYFLMVLDKIDSLLALMIVTEKTHDFIACAQSMIQGIQEQILRYATA